MNMHTTRKPMKIVSGSMNYFSLELFLPPKV